MTAGGAVIVVVAVAVAAVMVVTQTRQDPNAGAIAGAEISAPASNRRDADERKFGLRVRKGLQVLAR